MAIESIYDCPIGTALGTIPALACPAQPGNIQAIVLQLYQATPSFTSSSIGLSATWTPLLASATATGARAIPANNFETTPGEQITEGGNDQSTFRGRPKLKYMGFTSATYIMEGVEPPFAKAVKAYTKFSALAGQRTKLRAFLLTDDNYIISDADFNGLEIFNHTVGDAKKGGGFKNQDMYKVDFFLDYGWSLNMVQTKASFDVLNLVQFAV